MKNITTNTKQQKEEKGNKTDNFIIENCNFNFLNLAKTCKPKKINFKKAIESHLLNENNKTNLKNKDVKRVYLSYNSNLLFLTDGKAPNLKEQNYKIIGFLGQSDITQNPIDPFYFFNSEKENSEHISEMLKLWNNGQTFLTFNAYYNISEVKKVLTESIQAVENLRQSAQIFSYIKEEQKTITHTIKEMEKDVIKMFNGLADLSYETIRTAIL